MERKDPSPLEAALAADPGTTWVMFGASFVLATGAVVLSYAPTMLIVQAIGALAALVLGGFALSRQPGSPVSWLAAAGIAFMASYGFPADWDSGPRVARVLTVVALSGALLCAVSGRARWVMLSILGVVHFGGILTAVTGPPPQPYLSGQAWVLFYRPYLQFMYLNNAYQFYSPEPGPAVQLWAVIEYKTDDPDQRYQWFRMPVRPTHVRDPLLLSYYRRLALTERLNSLNPNPLESAAEQAQILARRNLRRDIPHHPQMTEVQEYRPPNSEMRRLVIPSFARHIISTHQREGLEVVSVKLYRVEHRMLPPADLSKGVSVFDPSWYLPFFYGEFDAEGNLLDSRDPMLYWLVPILYKTDSMTQKKDAKIPYNPANYRDFVEVHAGSKHGAFQP